MAWEIRAKCLKCEFTLPSFGPYLTERRTREQQQGTVTLWNLGEALREHEVIEHGGLS